MSSDSELIRAMARCLIAVGTAEKAKCCAELKKMLEAPAPTKFSGNTKEDAERIMMEIGAPAKLVGTRYCVKAIEIVIQNPRVRHKMMDIYKEVGNHFHSTPESVSGSIYNVVDTVFERGSIEVLTRYFGNAIDYDSGKVVPGEFIHRLAAYIRNHT